MMAVHNNARQAHGPYVFGLASHRVILFAVYLVVSSIARRSVDWGNIGWLGFIAYFVTFGFYSRVELRIVI